jgi:hypothetical protein
MRGRYRIEILGPTDVEYTFGKGRNMSENSMQKVGLKGHPGRDSGYKPSAPPNYRPPTPIKVPPPPVKQGK